MSNATHLQAAATTQATAQDRAVAAFARELQHALVLLNSKIRGLVGQLKTDGAGRLVRDQQNLGRAIRLRQDLLKAVDESGVTNVMHAAVDAPLDALVADVLKTSQIAQTFTALRPFDLDVLTAFKEIHLADLLDVSQDTATVLWRSTFDGVMGLRPVDDLLLDLADQIDSSLPRARTLYDTTVSTFVRQVDLLHTTGEPDELFLAAGPVDSKTREFCLERVGRVYSREDIERMDNGQMPSVMQTFGGWNCRHRWMRVSVLDEQLQELAKTGERQPHVQAMVDSAEEAA